MDGWCLMEEGKGDGCLTVCVGNDIRSAMVENEPSGRRSSAHHIMVSGHDLKKKGTFSLILRQIATQS